MKKRSLQFGLQGRSITAQGKAAESYLAGVPALPPPWVTLRAKKSSPP
jgi:hypothetical protein